MVMISAGLCRAASASTRARSRTAQDPLPDGPGKASLVVVCGSCHDVDTAVGMRHTSAEWKEVVDSMINRGAIGSDDEFKAVLGYLSTRFGIVNVNTAGAKEVEAVLDLSPSDAEAIVRYRMERGAFSSLDDLKMVPGVDALVIDQRKDRVRFK